MVHPPPPLDLEQDSGRMTKNKLAEDFLASVTRVGRFRQLWPRMKLYDYQEAFVNDASRYRIVNKSRQVGMTYIIAREAIMDCLDNPGETFLIVSVSERQAQHVINYIRAAIDEMAEPQPPEYNTKIEIRWPNGARIVSLPNSPSTVRGYKAKRVYIDEAAHVQHDRELMQAIGPSTSRGGAITLNSTPYGKRGIFWEIWSKAKELGYSVHEIPYNRCPELDLKVLKKQFGEMDEITFRQEFMCDFCDESMAFFPYDLIMKGVTPDLELVDMVDGPEDGSAFFAGIDFAKVRDETVITIVERTKDNKFFVRSMTVFAATPYSTQLRFIRSLPEKFPLSTIYIDSTGVGVKLLEELNETMGSLVVGVNFNAQSKEKMITELRVLFEQARIHIPDDQYLTAQLHQLERVETQGGVTRYRHAEGKHDDAVWSLALACFAGNGVEADGDIGVAVNTSVPDSLRGPNLADIEYEMSRGWGPGSPIQGDTFGPH